MVLTTGEIGLVAVGATLASVYVTLFLDRRRLLISRRERWLDDRRDAYFKFVKSTNGISNVCERITTALLKNEDKLPERTVKKYRASAEAANDALVELRLIGSIHAGNMAGRIVSCQKRILRLHPQFNPDPQPEKVDTKKLNQLGDDFRKARQDFIKVVRQELGIIDSGPGKSERLPDTALVLALKWFRKKMYDSYVRSQIKD